MPISKHDKQALADLFIHMGVPLVSALQTVESWSGSETEPQATRAEKLAKLLNISVEFATKITKKLEIRDAYTLENVRGKILKIVTPIIADHYILNGEMPDEAAISGLTDLFDVLLSFADSVSPTDEKGSKPTKIATMIEACEPLLSAIRDNDLGLGSDTAFQDSIAGLMKRTEQLGQALGIDHPVEDGLLKAVIIIYASCYKKGADMGSDIATIWDECDHRLALIHGLTGFVAETTGIEIQRKPKAIDKKDTSIAEKKTKKPPIDKEDDAKIVTSDTTNDNNDKNDDDEGDGDFDPMSFFSAGK